MSNETAYRLKLVSRLDAYVCHLTKVLGEPQVTTSGENLSTGWAFEHPIGERHWVVSCESQTPVVKDGVCNQQDMLTWNVYGETQDRQVLHDLVSYLLDGTDFYVE